MKQIRKRADELILIAAAIGPWTLLVVAVLIIGTLKCCLTTDSDSIDESINKSPGIVAHVMVLDSTDNGFRVVYATAEPVTDERFAEICDRPGILEGFENLKRKAPDLESVAKIHQMTEYSRNKLYDHVPDPYYGGASGFELVLDLLEDACGGLLETISSGRDN